MTQEEINEIKAIVREVLLEDGVLIDDDTAFPVTDSPGENALAWFMTQGTQNYGRTPFSGGSPSPTPSGSVSMAVSPATVYAGQASDITISVTTTADASSVTVYRGSVEVGRSSTAGRSWSFTDSVTPATAGVNVQYRAVAVMGGTEKSCQASVSVVEAPVQYSTVRIAHGTAFDRAVMRDTGEQLRAGLHLEQAVNAGEYIFLVVDNRQQIRLATTDNTNPAFNTEIEFDTPEAYGDDMVYKTKAAYARAMSARILIVTVSNNR